MARITVDGGGPDTGYVDFFNQPGTRGGGQSNFDYGVSPRMPRYQNPNPVGGSGGWWNPPGYGVNDPSAGPIDYGTGGGGNPFDYGQGMPKINGDGRTGQTPVRTGPMPRYPPYTSQPNAQGSGLFTQNSTYNDLINYLNTNHLDPNGAQSIVQQFVNAQGLVGNQGNPNGMQWGQFDPTRNKYYVPGQDIRYENGTWVPHAWGAGSDSYGTSTFNDPASQQYEQLLNQLIGQFMTPTNTPAFQSVDKYLNDYFQQLQQPVYTPEQRNIIQTQAYDPISKQRDATQQQIIQRFAAQGIPQSSGIVQKALQDSNQQFEQLRTQAGSSFANQEIAQGKQNQAAAAQLGPAITAYEQAPNTLNEQRALQAAQLAGIVPNMAWNRLTGANNLIQQTNPYSLLAQLYGFQNQGYQQGANYGQSIGNILSLLAPLFS